MARSPESMAKHRARVRAFKKKKRADPEFRRLEALKARERYWGNLEKYRKISRDWRSVHREESNEKRKKWRRDNPDLAREADRRSREISFKHAIARLRDGSMGWDEFSRRLGEALVRVDERTRS